MAQKTRTEIEDTYKWDLTPIYPSVEEWRKEKVEIFKKIDTVQTYQGRLGRSAATLLEFLEFDSELNKTLTKLSCYASLLSDEDVNNAENIALTKEIEQVTIDFAQKAAFVRPELASIPAATYAAFMKEQPGLSQYSMLIDRILRMRAHTLSDVEEALLAKMSIMGDTPGDTFNIFSDAEMPFPTIKLQSGEEVLLDHSAYSKVRASSVRADRETAFKAFWENYRKFEGTFGELMNGNLKRAVFGISARKYDSCLAAALHYNDIPVAVYKSLIDNVHAALPTFHRYLRLKQRLLGVDQLKYSDIYAPAVATSNLHFTYEEAKDLVLEALKPLGEDYVSVVRRAFAERWIDAMPSKGKATGAYSNGAIYDVHPYILMNFNELYDDLGTLIHELGHTMHSYLSNKNQPYATCDYSIFVAEVASTFNEALLDHLMLQKLTDRDERITLLMNMLDGFKGTLFRQTQFAEFQLLMSEMAEKGEPITGQRLTELYGSILRKYYGHDEGVCHIDRVENIEWAFIPHFYMGFYVYQYSTSFVASQALSEIVLKGGSEELKRYINFLSAGDSKYPITELKEAGVDMTTSEPFEQAMNKMNQLMDEIEKLV